MLGSISLDFAATRLGTAEELIDVPHRLGISSVPPDARPDQLSSAIVLRDALRRSFLHASRDEALEERDTATINSFAADEPSALTLTPARGLVRLALDPISGALADIARDAVALIAGRAQRLRACERADCGTIFLDVSHAGQRRWCSMRRCGNREKVAGYRVRRRLRR
ncbi:MAG: CGNR zinc finger domain-containing protein [Candidatus Eremiobacteraeota bacterium]|nr:CGNR zinc finger domain-containing protein [Candidatus Eremiobacteraeota bacterium]